MTTAGRRSELTDAGRAYFAAAGIEPRKDTPLERSQDTVPLPPEPDGYRRELVAAFGLAGHPEPQQRAELRVVTPPGRKPFASAYHHKDSKCARWRRTVAGILAGLRAHLPGRGELEGAFEIHFAFSIPRPVSHYGAGKNHARLLPSAPPFPTSLRTGDWDNLAKAVQDELSGILFDDDRQVVDAVVSKRYAAHGAPGGVRVCVYRWGRSGDLAK